MFELPKYTLVLGTATVIIEDNVQGRRSLLCPIIAAGEGAARVTKRVWKMFVKKLGAALALAAMAAWLGQQAPGVYVGPEHVPFVMGAITSAISSSFKTELGIGTHNFTVSTGDTVKTALFTSSATIGASTTAYATTNEITGTGYTAGGVTMANVTPVLSGTTAIFDWADAQWTTATFTANGSLTYNSSKSNKSIFSIAFGSDQTVTAGTFTIQWPTADASNAIIRF